MKMTKKLVAVGNRNKAESLFLLKGHEPRHRKHSDVGSSDDWEDKNYPPAGVENKVWAESTQRMAARFPSDLEGHRALEMEARFGPFGSKTTDEETEAFLGPLPKNEDLPDWLKEALSTKERKPQEVEKVKTPADLKRYPWLYGAIYGLLRYHSMTRDANDHPQTWVSVTRLAEEAGYSVRRVESILRDMERLSMISVEFRSGQSNLYTLLLRDPGRIGRVYFLREKKSAPFVEI